MSNDSVLKLDLVGNQFRLAVKSGFTVQADGTVVVWLNRNDLNDLSVQSANALLDDDMIRQEAVECQ